MPACWHAQVEEEQKHEDDACSHCSCWLGVPAPAAALLGGSEPTRYWAPRRRRGQAASQWLPLLAPLRWFLGVLRERCLRPSALIWALAPVAGSLPGSVPAPAQPLCCGDVASLTSARVVDFVLALCFLVGLARPGACAACLVPVPLCIAIYLSRNCMHAPSCLWGLTDLFWTDLSISVATSQRHRGDAHATNGAKPATHHSRTPTCMQSATHKTADGLQPLFPENTLGGQTLGQQHFLGPTSQGRTPSRNPAMPSAAFRTAPREGHKDCLTGCGADSVYAPAAPDYTVWMIKGFAEAGRKEVIKPETWGATPREPRDPFTTPAKCAPALLEHAGSLETFPVLSPPPVRSSC
jgi:hypothetical protein